jgi:cell division control protein 24
LVQRGVLGPEAAVVANDNTGNVKKTKRQHIVGELVNTERTYVQHLELLHEFKNLVEQRGVISGDAIHEIFHNLNTLLDLQRRFLIRVEQTNIQPESEQNWGALFTLYRDAFKVYEPYIANQKKCEQAVVREFSKLRGLQCPPRLQQFTENSTLLSAFLLKPFQRLSKYPLLLKVYLSFHRCTHLSLSNTYLGTSRQG